MENGYSPEEILKIAVKVEENGRDFYAAQEAKANDEQLKLIWQHLKKQELLHRETFKKMLDNIKDYIVYEYSAGEFDVYFAAIAKEYIFTQQLSQIRAKELLKSGSFDEILNFAVAIEKESILTYSALREYVISEKVDIIDEIINQEKQHLVKLKELKEKFKQR